MVQFSHAYAIGKISALSGNLIEGPEMERVANAATIEEAAKLLSDAGWGEANDRASLEALAGRHVVDTCRLIRSISPEPDVTDCFLLKYDILNLKVLAKEKMLGLKDTELSPCGTIDAELLRHCVAEGRYARLPDELRRVMEDIERHIALSPDPLTVDALLDKAMCAMISARLSGTRDQVVKEYFKASADLANIMIALRSHSMKKGGEFAGGLIVPGGSLTRRELLSIADGAERAQKYIKYEKYAYALYPGLDEYDKTGSLALVEKNIDDYLMSLMRKHRHDIGGILPLIGYLVGREREANSVRLIIAAKSSKIPQEKLIERLRELYV